VTIRKTTKPTKLIGSFVDYVNATLCLVYDTLIADDNDQPT